MVEFYHYKIPGSSLSDFHIATARQTILAFTEKCPTFQMKIRPQKVLCTAWLYILSALPFASGPLTLLPLNTTAIQTRLVAAMHPVCSWRAIINNTPVNNK